MNFNFFLLFEQRAELTAIDVKAVGSGKELTYEKEDARMHFRTSYIEKNLHVYFEVRLKVDEKSHIDFLRLKACGLVMHKRISTTTMIT